MFTVSAIIPSYNQSSRLDRSIKSVLNQIHQISEVIVIDDGSVDKTSEVVKKYGNSVTYLSQENKGPGSARNTGIRFSSGEWVAFLDADDEWTPQHIQTAIELLKQHPEIVWFCAGYEIRNENGSFINRPRKKLPLTSEGIIGNYFSAQALTTFSVTSAMLVKRTVFDEIGFFNEKLPRGEDLDLWFRIALTHPQLAYASTPGCIYWRVSRSITTRERSINIPRFLDRIDTTRQSIQTRSKLIMERSNYLVQAWVISAIKCAILQNEKDSLTLIRSRYEQILPLKWKIILRTFEHSLSLQAVEMGLSIRSEMRK